MNLRDYADSSVLGGVWVLDIETATEQILCKSVHWVLWLFCADGMQSISQEHNKVILQVLADGLRVFVDDVFLGLAEHLNIKLGRCLLLFLYDLLKVLLP